MVDIDLNEYKYVLPTERIAQFPLAERDKSKLLVSQGDRISTDFFINIGRLIPQESLLVFNNSRVIRARILFSKESGATIELLCLEPQNPCSYQLSLSSGPPVQWKCMIGNLKKWKNNTISGVFGSGKQKFLLKAEKIRQDGDTCDIRFEWDNAELDFGQVIESSGHVPLPPYITREDNDNDAERYQTVYSRVEGSVAAPTAGLHFSETVLDDLTKRNIKKTELTLHVGAGTFQPVKARNISDHKMHHEHYYVPKETIKLIKDHNGHIIPVGTTAVRTIESLYWLGTQIWNQKAKSSNKFFTGQWDPYQTKSPLTASESLDCLLEAMESCNMSALNAATGIIIIPGYEFRLTSAMITNFHLPGSTLILLVAAWLGKKWKTVYKYALDNDFRFLSYGDSSLLFK